MYRFISIVAMAILLSSCTTSEKQTSGTLIGAAGGALIGSSFGGGAGRYVGAAIGAAGGAYLGNEVGKKF